MDGVGLAASWGATTTTGWLAGGARGGGAVRRGLDSEGGRRGLDGRSRDWPEVDTTSDRRLCWMLGNGACAQDPSRVSVALCLTRKQPGRMSLCTSKGIDERLQTLQLEGC
jgi:hypothetical protein